MTKNRLAASFIEDGTGTVKFIRDCCWNSVSESFGCNVFSYCQAPSGHMYAVYCHLLSLVSCSRRCALCCTHAQYSTCELNRASPETYRICFAAWLLDCSRHPIIRSKTKSIPVAISNPVNSQTQNNVLEKCPNTDPTSSTN